MASEGCLLGAGLALQALPLPLLSDSPGEPRRTRASVLLPVDTDHGSCFAGISSLSWGPAFFTACAKWGAERGGGAPAWLPPTGGANRTWSVGTATGPLNGAR